MQAVLVNGHKNGKTLENRLWSPDLLQQSSEPSSEEVKVPIDGGGDAWIEMLKNALEPGMEEVQIVLKLGEDGKWIETMRGHPSDTKFTPEADGESDQELGWLQMSTKRTYQPSVIVRKRRHGFLARLRSVGGRRIISRRKLKGRRKLTA